MSLTDELTGIPLVDQHCHGVVLDPLDRSQFELLLTEARDLGPKGTSEFDTQVGLAVRRWCAPLLGLDAHADPDSYLARRASIGPQGTARMLLRACGASDLLVDTGLNLPGMCDLAELADVARRAGARGGPSGDGGGGARGRRRRRRGLQRCGCGRLWLGTRRGRLPSRP